MVTDEISLEDIAGGALFLDGEQIALSSVFDTQPKDHFTQALLTNVIDGGERNPNIRSLVFKTAKCTILDEMMGFGIEYLYNKSMIAFDPDAKRDFITYITQLRDFLYCIEDFFNGIIPGTNEDRGSWMSLSVEEILFDKSPRREIPLLI